MTIRPGTVPAASSSKTLEQCQQRGSYDQQKSGLKEEEKHETQLPWCVDVHQNFKCHRGAT